MKTNDLSSPGGSTAGPAVLSAATNHLNGSEATPSNHPIPVGAGPANSPAGIAASGNAQPYAAKYVSPLRYMSIQPARKAYRLVRSTDPADPGRQFFATHRNPLPVWKRVLDIVCCLLALPALGFLTLVMTVVTGLVSPGPVFFRQERVGHQGRRFKILKFRTMRVGADELVHQKHFSQLVQSRAPMAKLDTQGDSRLIPGGWALRASGLDELPQLINILRGEMSLVGPRPCMPCEFAQYLPAQRDRVNALPGMTGLWQVSGKNRTTFEEMIRLDIRYTRDFSLLLDLKIIVLTPWALAVQIWDTSQGRKSRTHAEVVGPMGNKFEQSARPAA